MDVDYSKQGTAMDTATVMNHIPLGSIVPGNNPRRYFCSTAMEELTESIRQKGVIQPICVNVIEGGKFQIIAGERRYRAAIAAGLSEIPAMIRTVDSDEAESMALIENVIRENMSATEEAVAAGKILAKNNNDREETARELGWHVSKLHRRLALLNLVPEVMDALNERRIQLGHAELLAAVPKDKQSKALQTVETLSLTVQQVKELLAKVSTTFETAIFDTGGCSACQYNSEQQGALFAEAIEKGRCTNQSCYNTKTRQRIESLREEVASEVQTVKIIEIGDVATPILLAADGNLGVGAAQYEACLACANFGATVSALPGEEGKVTRSVCFDPDCHRKKVTERIKEEDKTRSKGGSVVSATDQTSFGTKTHTEKKASALSERVVEYRRKSVWEPAARNELEAQPDRARAFVLDLLLSGDAGKADRTKMARVFEEISGGENYPIGATSEGYPEKPYALDHGQQEKLITTAAVSALGAINADRLKKLLGFLNADLGKHWKITQEFLALLTKSEIEAVCKNVGIDAVVKDLGKIMAGKKEEAIQTILNSDFQFEGAVPDLLNY